MRVWRVERASCGQGPFGGLRGLSHALDRLGPQARDERAFHDLPCPQSSEESGSELWTWYAEVGGYRYMPDDWVFGFASLEQLLEWFRPCHRAALREFGFELTEWEVEESAVRRGHHQLAFDRKRARCVSRGDLTSPSCPVAPRLQAAYELTARQRLEELMTPQKPETASPMATAR